MKDIKEKIVRIFKFVNLVIFKEVLYDFKGKANDLVDLNQSII